MGFLPDGSLNGRTWTYATPPGTWIQENNGAIIWFSPLLSGTSTGAGAKETFPLE